MKIETSFETRDEQYEIEIVVESISEIVPAKVSRTWEDCYPEEGGEIEFGDVRIMNGLKKGKYLDLDTLCILGLVNMDALYDQAIEEHEEWKLGWEER